MNIRDEDSITNKSTIKSLERKNLTKENEIYNELLIYGIHLELQVILKNFQFRLTYFGEE